jgi:hypothetical protein
MNKLNIDSITFEKKSNNVSLGNSSEYDEQNKIYLQWGFTEYNTEYYQQFELPDEFHKFAKSIFSNYSLSVIKQMPGQTIPEHIDTFYQFSLKNNCDRNDVCRLNFFLEDWKTGHYFEMDSEPVLKWKSMDFQVIRYGVPHLSGNNGKEPKYTMQITGLYDEFKRSEAYTKSNYKG